MSRAGITAGLSGLLGVALAIAPLSPGHATRAPVGDASRVAATSTPHQSTPRAKAPKPSVKKVSPQTGSTLGGFDVVIKGRDLTGVKRVLFGSARATDVRGKSGRKLVVRAPAHDAGAVPLRVVTKHGSSKQNEATTFTYVNPVPALASLSPRTGPAAGGATVTISGSGLSGATAVRFGGSAAAAFRVVSPTTISATTPARPAGPVNVTVTTSGGTATLDDSYSFVAAPDLTLVAPGSGPTDGATVTLSGAGFTSDSVVTFGGSPATNVQVFGGGTSLTARTPGHPPGWVDVAVTTPGGTATLTRGYLFAGAVTLTGVSPGVGPTVGLVDVTLTGAGFTPDTLVVFGTKPSFDVTVNASGTQLTAELPAQAAGTVDVLVSTEGDSDTLFAGFTYVAAPTLASVSPTAGPLAAGTPVTLTGTGFRSGMQVLFGGAPATGVSVNGAGTQLTAVAPAHAAGAVDVSVSTPGGSADLASAYTYVAVPTLTAVSPDAGPIAGGTTVTLTGSGFRAGMSVTFGGVAATGVAVTSATQATVSTPAHAAGTVTVVVTTPGGSVTNSYTYVVPPTLTAVSPDAGPIAGGTTLTLSGGGFRTGMTVTIGGLPATGVDLISATQLTVVTPEHPAGAVSVTVTTPGGSASMGNSFSYLAAPTLGSVAPAAGPTAGGTTVTLSGASFRAGMQVTVGGLPATGVSVSPGGTQLTAVTPAHGPGLVNVSVTTPGGSDALGEAYSYVVVPALTDVTPDSGPLAGGTTVTLTGSGFRAGTQVLFGSTPATGVSVNPGGTELTATTPPHPAGAVAVSVSTPGGSAALSAGYTYVAAPTLTALSPDAGPVAGGTTVTLTGSGFRPGLQVLFGAIAATSISIDPGGTQLTALAPAHAPGGVDVSVSTPGGTATLGNSYTYLVAPTVTSVSPVEGPAAGGTTATVNGSGFRAGMQVRFGGVLASVVSVNSAGTVLTATTPPHAAGLVDLSVATPGGADALTNAFTYVAAPTLGSVSPSAGPVTGGTAITLTGTGFRAGTQVSVGGTPAAVVSIDPGGTSLVATTPPHAAGAVGVSVATVGGSATLVDGFTYVAAPTLTAVSPDAGPVTGGTSVTLTGTGLTGTTSVTFGGVAATDVVVVDASTVTAVAPGHVAGLVDVALATVGGSATLADAFTYVAAPTLTSVTPDAGPVTGGTTVTLTGTDLTGTTSVTFGGVAATDVVVVDASTVTAVAPGHVAGLVDVALTTVGGSATLADAFTYVAAPTLTSVTPDTVR